MLAPQMKAFQVHRVFHEALGRQECDDANEAELQGKVEALRRKDPEPGTHGAESVPDRNWLTDSCWLTRDFSVF